MTIPDDHLPPRLQDALRQAYRTNEPFSADRDAVVLAAFRPARRRWIPLSAAAGIALLLTGGLLYHLGAGSAAGPGYVRTGDIRDAFYVARELAAGQQVAGDWDANHDGRVDNGDVRQLAMLAVRISP